MPKESYAKIWTTIGVLTLYCTLNMYLEIQGSEITFGYLDFSDMGKQSISLYAMLIFIPSFLMLLGVSFSFLKEHKNRSHWTHGFPVAFNLKLDSSSSSGKKYQIFFFILFFFVPVVLQYHNLKVFFRTPVYFKADPNIVIANDFKSHLLNFEPFKKSFGNEYGFGDSNDNPVTFFPAYESWIFLLLELLIIYWFVRYLITIFKVTTANNNLNRSG